MAKAAREAGYDVTEIDATRELARQLAEAKPDAVLNGLHGPWGEDGSVQGLLEIMGLPYSETELLTTASGGTPYGPSHTAGTDSKRPVTGEEKALCVALGRRLARGAVALLDQ